LEFLLSFFVSFFLTWVLLNVDNSSVKKECPMKETMIELATQHSDNKNLVREIRHYSHLQIQNGYYDYGEVLQELSKKESKT